LKIEKFDSLESTNKYCEALDLAQVEDFTCYWALEQTAGIGQRGNHWHSAPKQNLTFSLVLHPTFLPADRQFKLTETLSLAICDCIKDLMDFKDPKDLKDLKVKWPNDIYVGNKKICGTLVSTRITTQAIKQTNNQAIISSAICGIGLNVNQTSFPAWVPNPTSLALLSGKEYTLEPLLKDLLCCIERRYDSLKSGLDPEPEYLKKLMNRGVSAQYKYKGEEIAATITGVDPFGHLLLTAADGNRISCGMKEISFLTE
jgi:BirA family biotin operon repressor/biotin-[acetyl-CoA-carboxylase] ligase